MKNLYAVIGANYGDEGKGLMTDYFAARDPLKSLVVRFNGGAQAGHTVEIPPEDPAFAKRHVFHHFGSGTFAGATTYLGPRFIVNPILFNREYQEIKNTLPKVYVNSKSLVTTPYDMLINQWLEKSRGLNRHGSCGVGIHETEFRDQFTTLRVSDLYNDDLLHGIITFIRQKYIPNRLNELNIPETPEIKKILNSSEFAGKFMDECRDFKAQVELVGTKYIFDKFETIIFEGAQGLLLDQDFGRFPYVTHSNTGLKNVVELIRESKIDPSLDENTLNVCYVTRWYMTRHGEGPFPNEYGSKPMYPTMIDRTNETNEWQGELRYGFLDLNDLHARIEFDRTKYLPSHYWHQIQLAITCLDQAERNKFYHDGVMWDFPMTRFLQTLQEEMMLDKLYGSYGPSRNKVVEMKGVGE